MNATELADMLLEVNTKKFITGFDDWEWYMQDFGKKVPPEFKPIRAKWGKHQWETHYNKWMVRISTYEDGKTLWSAHYPVPRFPWNKGKGQQYSGGSDLVELPAGADLNAYWQKLKRFIDRNPDPWRDRHIPPTPDPRDWDYDKV
jgi:hypothetical protein